MSTLIVVEVGMNNFVLRIFKETCRRLWNYRSSVNEHIKMTIGRWFAIVQNFLEPCNTTSIVPIGHIHTLVALLALPRMFAVYKRILHLLFVICESVTAAVLCCVQVLTRYFVVAAFSHK